LQATQTQLAALSKQRDRLTVLASGFFKVLQMSLAEDIKDLPEEVQDDQDAELVENFSANQIYRLKGVLTDLYSHIYSTCLF
jgi:hypothetical protein